MILRLLLLVSLTACSSPAYYFQATSGQMKLMRARQDIQTILDDPAADQDLISDLRTAQQIKAFAHSKLGLPDNGSYSSYVEINTDALVWNVIATEEFSLQPKEWCFLVAGCVPYRGYFKQQKAMESAAHLRNKGMDVFVSPAAAYSTLGWFQDPLLSTMTSGSDIRLAAYLFHELAHQRLYVKDDGPFNEAYASFVESTGVEMWLDSKQRQEDWLEWQHLQKAGSDFSNLIANVREALGDLYRSEETDDSKRSQKSRIFASLAKDYDRLRTRHWQGKRYYDSWFEQPVNNARIALYDTYEGGQCAFGRLLDSVAGDIQAFHHLAEQQSRLKKDERELWLKQTCATMSPTGTPKKNHDPEL